jgi:hypothetical protein
VTGFFCTRWNLRQIEVSIGNGKTTPQACNEAGITRTRISGREYQEFQVLILSWGARRYSLLGTDSELTS